MVALFPFGVDGIQLRESFCESRKLTRVSQMANEVKYYNVWYLTYCEQGTHHTLILSAHPH